MYFFNLYEYIERWSLAVSTTTLPTNPTLPPSPLQPLCTLPSLSPAPTTSQADAQHDVIPIERRNFFPGSLMLPEGRFSVWQSPKLTSRESGGWSLGVGVLVGWELKCRSRCPLLHSWPIAIRFLVEARQQKVPRTWEGLNVNIR